MKKNRLFEQRQIPLLGALNQLLGGAIGWFTMLTFFFSAITAWNTPTLAYVREILPWLTIYSFIGLVIGGIVVVMWLQHKYIQPSSVNYWRKMFYDNNPSEERLKNIEKLLMDIIQKE